MLITVILKVQYIVRMSLLIKTRVSFARAELLLLIMTVFVVVTLWRVPIDQPFAIILKLTLVSILTIEHHLLYIFCSTKFILEALVAW